MSERAAFICSHVFDRSRPILLVGHSNGGDWQFLCGAIHEGTKPHVVGINHLLERDPSLIELLDLPEGWEAERQAVGLSWERWPPR